MVRARLAGGITTYGCIDNYLFYGHVNAFRGRMRDFMLNMAMVDRRDLLNMFTLRSAPEIMQAIFYLWRKEEKSNNLKISIK